MSIITLWILFYTKWWYSPKRTQLIVQKKKTTQGWCSCELCKRKKFLFLKIRLAMMLTRRVSSLCEFVFAHTILYNWASVIQNDAQLCTFFCNDPIHDEHVYTYISRNAYVYIHIYMHFENFAFDLYVYIYMHFENFAHDVSDLVQNCRDVIC